MPGRCGRSTTPFVACGSGSVQIWAGGSRCISGASAPANAQRGLAKLMERAPRIRSEAIAGVRALAEEAQSLSQSHLARCGLERRAIASMSTLAAAARIRAVHNVERTEVADARAPPAIAPIVADNSGARFARAIDRARASAATRRGICETIVMTINAAPKLPVNS